MENICIRQTGLFNFILYDTQTFPTEEKLNGIKWEYLTLIKIYVNGTEVLAFKNFFLFFENNKVDLYIIESDETCHAMRSYK